MDCHEQGGRASPENVDYQHGGEAGLQDLPRTWTKMDTTIAEKEGRSTGMEGPAVGTEKE